MVKINKINKSYGNTEVKNHVLKDVSLEINDGDFVVILGPSGSGKSTLLNCISGLDKIDDGEIIYNEIDISKLNDKDLTKFRRDNIAYIFQSYYLMPSLNVYTNIKMGANLRPIGVNNINNKSEKPNEEEINSYIKAVGLDGKEKAFPNQLSGGEMQRVSIARALAKKPKVLFCDEPTGALDEETGRIVLKYIISLQRRDKFTIVMVTHNQNLSLLANVIVKMNSGKIVTIENNEPKSIDEIGW